MRKPNFFIIGAPKCGTTSLTNWLSYHPNIYMPRKEIHWFNQDHGGGYVNSLDEYERLFTDATNQHIALGDSSVWYLFSKVAVKNIVNYIHNSKFIVLVRNPIDMATSLHGQLFFMGQENVRDFGTAWRLQERRSIGVKVPALCEDAEFLQYGRACMLGAQVERLYATVGRSNVLVLILDDLRNNSHKEYLKVLKFISVPDDGRIKFPVFNVAKNPRFFIISQLISMIARTKQMLGIKGGIGGLWLLDRVNRKKQNRKLLKDEVKMELIRYFKEDINKLSALLGRDFSIWLEY
jgi:hypothetical protein